MTTRTKHHWRVQLQNERGEMVARDVFAYWDPEQEETKEAVERTAAAEAWWQGKKQVQFAPIASELVL